MNIHTLVQYLDTISNTEESNLLRPTDSANSLKSYGFASGVHRNSDELRPEYFTNSSPIYTFLGNPEEESTVLSTNLDLCVDPLFWTATDTKLRVYICMYRRTQMVIPVCSKVRDVLPIEYLSFFMEKNEKSEYSFPSFLYRCNDTTAESEEDGLKSACINHILTVRSLEQTGAIGNSKIYGGEAVVNSYENIGFKGFIEDKKNVFVFFDSDKFETGFQGNSRERSSSEFPRELWAIVDEILHKKKVLGAKIDPVIVRMFTKNPIAWNIKYNGQDIAYPRQMYALIPSNFQGVAESVGRSQSTIFGRDENAYETETYPSTGKTLLHMSMALPYSYSDIFADRYLFTNEPQGVAESVGRSKSANSDELRSLEFPRIPSASRPEYFRDEVSYENVSEETKDVNYKRYACFVYNPRTILDPTYKPHHACIKKYPNNTIDHIRLEAEDDEMAEDIRETPCIVFVDDLRSPKRKGKKIERTTIWGFLQYTYFREL
jgi:hypothetical protein